MQVAAPRTFQLQQHWRKEDDGSYIILFKSSQGPTQPPKARSSWSWYQPVEAKVIHYEIWKYWQSTSKVHAYVLRNLRVLTVLVHLASVTLTTLFIFS